jgi:hypothetical protein
LRNRIDPAFVIIARTQATAIIVEGTQIPVAIPRVKFQRLGNAGRLLAVRFRVILHKPTKRAETRQWGVQKPAQPDALAALSHPHPVHSIVPISRPYQRQLVRAGGGSFFDRPAAMFIKRIPFRGRVVLTKTFGFFRLKCLRFQVGINSGYLSRSNVRQLDSKMMNTTTRYGLKTG